MLLSHSVKEAGNYPDPIIRAHRHTKRVVLCCVWTNSDGGGGGETRRAVNQLTRGYIIIIKAPAAQRGNVVSLSLLRVGSDKREFLLFIMYALHLHHGTFITRAFSVQGVREKRLCLLASPL